nr:hypothetical protein [Tanacetum cinerariifolium]
MLVQGLIFQGEGSTVLAESHHTPTGAPLTSQPLSPTPRETIRQETRVPQPSSPPHTNVADEAASTGVDVRHKGAATTVTSLDAGHGSGNIDKTPSIPYDSPLLRVHTLGSDESKMQHNELMDLVTKLSDSVVSLETDLQQIKKVYGIAYTKLIKKVKSTANVPVNTAGAEISTASPKVKIAGDSVDDIATESLVYIKRSAEKRKDKGKVIMEESSEPTQTKTKIQQEQERLGVNTFTPMESDDTVPKVATGSSKRSTAEELGEESFKDKRRLSQTMESGSRKLYESCGVNHVSTPDGIDIFMLVEKEYPLSKGTFTLMLILKLMVEQDNEISRELIRKIFMQVERPRR